MALTKITSDGITDATIVNADINESAAIAGTKVSPNFGSQNVVTTGTLGSGDITITGGQPALKFIDDGANPDYNLYNNNGVLRLYDITNAADRLVVNTDGHIDVTGNLDVGAGLDVTGNITVSGTVDGVDIAALNTTVSGKLSNIVEDTTPQLGGDLDMNSKFISSGILGVKNTGSQSEVRLYCEVSNAHYVAVKAPPHAQFSGNPVFQLPPNGGTNGYFLKTNGSGVTSWAAVSTDLVNDTSPQLGGDLASNGHDIKIADATGYDGNNIYMGSDNDCRIIHDGSNFSITEATGDVTIQSADDIFLKPQGGENGIKIIGNGSVELYENSNKKFETTSVGVEITGNATSSIVTLTDGSNIAVDLSSGTHFTVTLGGNRTFVNSGMNTANAIGSSGSIFIVQDSTGSRTASFQSDYKFAGGTAPTLSTSANAVDRLDFIVRATNNVHCVVTLDVK